MSHTGTTGRATQRRRALRRNCVAITALGAVSGLLLTSCGGFPSQTSPVVISEYRPEDQLSKPIQPLPTDTAESVLRKYFQASADSSDGFAAALDFWEGDAQEAATDCKTGQMCVSRELLIVFGDDPSIEERRGNRPGSALTAKAEDKSYACVGSFDNVDEIVSFVVKSPVVGYRKTNGAYQTDYKEFGEEYALGKDSSGVWRIVGGPCELYVSGDVFSQKFAPQKIYFPAKGKGNLVGDTRWLPQADDVDRAESLIGALIGGPSGFLRPAVRAPKKALESLQFVGIQRDRGQLQIDFSGLEDLPRDERRGWIAQVLWTLYLGGVDGPYEIRERGQVVSAADDVAGSDGSSDAAGGRAGSSNTLPIALDPYQSLDPRLAAKPELRGLQDGKVVSIDGAKVMDETGPISLESVDSVAYSYDNRAIAAVDTDGAGAGTGKRLRLLPVVGGQDSAWKNLRRAASFTRPSWNGDGTELYSVINGRHLLYVERNPATGAVQSFESDLMPALNKALTEAGLDPKKVDGGDVDAPTGPRPEAAPEATALKITSLRVHHDGVHVAIIANGTAFTGVLVKSTDSTGRARAPRLDNVRLVASAYRGNIESLALAGSGKLWLGMRGGRTPVYSVDIDGSNSKAEPATNLKVPILSLAVDDNNVYALDHSTLKRLDIRTPETWKTWLQGVDDGERSRIVPFVQG